MCVSGAIFRMCEISYSYRVEKSFLFVYTLTMEPMPEAKFNPDFARDLLLEVTQLRTLDQLLKKIVQRLVERPNVALFRIWLIEKGDICHKCVRRPDCPDQTQCLHTVAGGGKSIVDPNDDFSSIDDCLARVPLGVG